MESCCTVENCDRPAKAKGLCTGHLRRLERDGELRPEVPLRAKRANGAPPSEVLARAVRSTDAPPHGLAVPCLRLSGKAGDGRAYVLVGKAHVPAARLAYETWVGPIPAGQNVLHHCDVGDCIEPTHLYTGDQQRNMADKIERGRDRSPLGEDNGRARLTEDAVRSIRRRRTDGETMTSIASDLGVSTSTVKAVVDRRTWAHVADLSTQEIGVAIEMRDAGRTLDEIASHLHVRPDAITNSVTPRAEYKYRWMQPRRLNRA